MSIKKRGQIEAEAFRKDIVLKGRRYGVKVKSNKMYDRLCNKQVVKKELDRLYENMVLM